LAKRYAFRASDVKMFAIQDRSAELSLILPCSLAGIFSCQQQAIAHIVTGNVEADTASGAWSR
jgi:hypothetical protein